MAQERQATQGNGLAMGQSSLASVQMASQAAALAMSMAMVSSGSLAAGSFGQSQTPEIPRQPASELARLL